MGEPIKRELVGSADIQKELVRKRMEVLGRLYKAQERSRKPIILRNVPVNEVNAVAIANEARMDVQRAFADPRRRANESSGVILMKYKGVSGDSKLLYGTERIVFESIGTPDSVEPWQRDVLGAGMVEFHTHVASRPDYLHQIDIPDLIGAIEGPAFDNPATGSVDPAVRVFGIMSVERDTVLQLFYHNLKDDLSQGNMYGLRKFGKPVLIR